MLRVLPPTNQDCLTTNQVVTGYKKLLQKVESSSIFCSKVCHDILPVLPAQGKLVLQKVM